VSLTGKRRDDECIHIVSDETRDSTTILTTCIGIRAKEPFGFTTVLFCFTLVFILIFGQGFGVQGCVAYTGTVLRVKECTLHDYSIVPAALSSRAA
jgi:hypothetical protein